MDYKTKLLSLINFDHPSMAKAKALKDQDQTDACVAEIIRHFRTRENPKYFFTMDDLRKNTDVEGLLQDAQEILDRKIYGYQFEGDIDWHFNPTDGILNTAHDNEWSWSLYRFIFWQPLARAYALTGDERYPAEALYQLKGFVNRFFSAFPEIAVFVIGTTAAADCRNHVNCLPCRQMQNHIRGSFSG